MDDVKVPCGVTLWLTGYEQDGHVFHVVVEESSGALATMRGEDVEMPWLRAACSCGWKADDDQRTTIEENSMWRWSVSHIDLLK